MPTESFAGRPETFAAEAHMGADFLAKLGGPSADFTELGLRAIEDLSVNELKATIAAAGMTVPSGTLQIERLQGLAREALMRAAEMSRRRSSVLSVAGPDGGAPSDESVGQRTCSAPPVPNYEVLEDLTSLD